MSYLQPPRLIFAGQFQADPSTVNNDPEHFDPSRFQSNFQLPGAGASNGWWNPGGTAAFRFFGCTVKRVVYGDGTVCDDPSSDPVVGMPINGSDVRVEGKIVDLDPEQQMVSQIWGFQVVLGRPGALGFRSDFEVAAFADIWTRFPQGQPDSFFGAFYQSILTVTDWNGAAQSRFLQELEAKSAPSGANKQRMLSIKFNVDGYDDDSTTPTFTLGRVVGSIGAYDPAEPHSFVAGRALLAPANAQPSWGTAYAVIDGNALLLDLGNSIPTTSVGGPPVHVQGLAAAVLPPNAAPVLLGEIDYEAPGWYAQTGGIVALPLNAAQLDLAQSNPLGMVLASNLQAPPLLAESADGSFVRADQYVFRMDPGDTKSTTLYATQFGQRWAGQPISLQLDPSSAQGQVLQGPLPGPPVGEPTSALTFTTPLTTGGDGTAQLALTASDPGNPRKYIDGQVYGITYGLGPTPPAVGSVGNPSQLVNALVFSGYQIPPRPNWLEHVQPIFQQYADLYPVMRPIVDLANFANVLERTNILKNVFNAPQCNPNYMPVTRDLSTAKRQMILNWLDDPLYMQLDSATDLMQALQIAVELEHSTIPPYLCALYSIKLGTNVEVAQLIRSIVIEEMRHMLVVCNILISLGGSPNIGHAKFVPTYPGPLPGGLRSGLVVRLRRCSIEQIRDCFMSIEEPEETVVIKRMRLHPNYPVDPHLYTIGWFYDEIKKSLDELSKGGKITFGNVDKQVQDFAGLGPPRVIKSLADALAAIDEIKEQGEGRGPLDPDDPEKELAHYYKFAEIVAGRQLVRGKDGFSYTGAPIPFDPSGVWPMLDDPNIVRYPAGSRARLLSMQFAQAYQALLAGLNRTFNGEPDYLHDAIGSMYSLDVAARHLVQTPSGLNDGTTAGPSFQLPVPGLAFGS